jgi:hypothetical protein
MRQLWDSYGAIMGCRVTSLRFQCHQHPYCIFVKLRATFTADVGEVRCATTALLFAVAGFSICGAEHWCIVSRL